MSLRFFRGYWDALRILPISGKALLIAGYVLSGIIYWSATIATPSPNAQCLNGSCVVTTDQVASTKILGIALLELITAMAVISLTIINITLDKNPEKRDKLLGAFPGVSTEHFWNQFSTPQVRKGFSKFNGFIWTVLFPSVNPSSLVFFLIAGFLVTMGSTLITIGTYDLHRLTK